MEQKKDIKGRNLKQGEDQLKDGRYRYRYTDRYGKRKAVYSWKLVKTDKTPQGKKDCLCLREIEKNIEKDVDEGILTYQANTLTVYDLIMGYFSIKPQIANSTMQNYIHMVNKNIKDNKLGLMKVMDVKKSDIKRFYAYLYEERNFASSTLQLYQNIIFPAFQMAVDDDLIRKNPCKDCMKDYVRGGLSSTKYPLTRQEQRALLEYVKNSNIYSKYYAIIAFMLATGCRIGEVIGLTWDDIDFEKKIVHINKTIQSNILNFNKENGNNTTYNKIKKSTKTKSGIRILQLNDDVIFYLSELKEYDKRHNITSQFVSCTNVGILNTARNLQRSLDRLIKKTDITKRVTLHTLRHTFGSTLLRHGVGIEVISKLMGHSNITITYNKYIHSIQEEEAKAMTMIRVC